MQLEIYELLCAESKRCITRRKWRYGSPYVYKPRRHLVKRLALQLNKTEEQIKKQISRERQFLLGYPQYF